MADVKNVKDAEDLSVVTVSAKVIGKIIGVGDRQVRNLAESGILKRNRRGQYLLVDSLANYIMALKVQKAGETVRTDFDEPLDLNREKAVHEHIKTMITDIKLQLIRGQVHKSEDVERVMLDMFEKFRSKLNALPAKLAPRLANKDKVYIQGYLRKEIDDVLMELSEYNARDFYSDEHIDIGEEDILAAGGETDEK